MPVSGNSASYEDFSHGGHEMTDPEFSRVLVLLE
jgi:hypothetical protein